MTIPIYDDNGAVEGVFGLTYHSQNFNDALQIESFDGQGYSYAINNERHLRSPHSICSVLTHS